MANNLPAPAELLAHTGMALALDELTKLVPGQYARGLWTPDERYFEGHFHILPGHWTVESLALTGACALLAERPGILPYFREAQVVMKGMVKPGDTLELEASYESIKEARGMIIAQGVGSVSVNGSNVLTASLIKAVAASPVS